MSLKNGSLFHIINLLSTHRYLSYQKAIVFFLVSGIIPLREVSLDKVRPWKPLFKATQRRSIASHLMLEKKAKDHKTAYEQLGSMPMVKVGYEVYADGLTRVIRICEVSKSLKGDSVFRSRSKIQFRITHLGIQLLEKVKQVSRSSTSLFAP